MQLVKYESESKILFEHKLDISFEYELDILSECKLDVLLENALYIDYLCLRACLSEYRLMEICLVDNLRYRLLPYIYTINYWIYKYHYSLTRSLIFHFCCNDINTYNIYQQFMFATYMLISIILKNNNTTNIYLPSNNCKYWYNF